jgi:hypothetical protein
MRIANTTRKQAAALTAVSVMYLMATGAVGCTVRFPTGSKNDGGTPGEAGAAKDADTDAGGSDAGCAGGCMVAPNSCYLAPGSCVQNNCQFQPKSAGEWCTDNDECTSDDSCDGAGNCRGTAMNCDRDNATGGTCTDGVCGGWSCEGDWRNCDDNWSNGCEILVGVANTCDLINGMNSSTGCGTAWCGSSSSWYATNYGNNWYCIACQNCHEEPDDWVAWCNIQTPTGLWYTAQHEPGGSCNNWDDQVCGP